MLRLHAKNHEIHATSLRYDKCPVNVRRKTRRPTSGAILHETVSHTPSFANTSGLLRQRHADMRLSSDARHGIPRLEFRFDMCIFYYYSPYISVPPLLRVSIITCITTGAVRTKAWPGGTNRLQEFWAK